MHLDRVFGSHFKKIIKNSYLSFRNLHRKKSFRENRELNKQLSLTGTKSGNKSFILIWKNKFKHIVFDPNICDNYLISIPNHKHPCLEDHFHRFLLRSIIILLFLLKDVPLSVLIITIKEFFWTTINLWYIKILLQFWPYMYRYVILYFFTIWDNCYLYLLKLYHEKSLSGTALLDFIIHSDN